MYKYCLILVFSLSCFAKNYFSIGAGIGTYNSIWGPSVGFKYHIAEVSFSKHMLFNDFSVSIKLFPFLNRIKVHPYIGYSHDFMEKYGFLSPNIGVIHDIGNENRFLFNYGLAYMIRKDNKTQLPFPNLSIKYAF